MFSASETRAGKNLETRLVIMVWNHCLSAEPHTQRSITTIKARGVDEAKASDLCGSEPAAGVGHDVRTGEGEWRCDEVGNDAWHDHGFPILCRRDLKNAVGMKKEIGS